MATEIAPAERPGRLHRLPLVPVAAAMVGGILAGTFLSCSTGLYAFLAAAALAAAILTALRKRFRPLAMICLLAAVASLAAIETRARRFNISDSHIVTYTANQRRLAHIRGRIVSSPMLLEDAPDRVGYPRPPRSVFLIETEWLRAGDEWRPVDGLVKVTVADSDERFRTGQRVEAFGWAGRFRPPGNPGQFDWAAHNRGRGILVWMSVPTADSVAVLSEPGGSWLGRMVWRCRAATRQHLLATGDRQQGQLLGALILGHREPGLGRLNELMARSGVAHFLSVSGLHLGIFLGFVYFICRISTLSQRRSAVVVLVVLGAYLLLAEPRPPLLRSSLMATMMCLATISRRRISHLNALAAAGVILLAIDPLQLFDAGFQMSFAIVAGLLTITRSVRRRLFRRWLQQRGLMVFRREHRLRRWMWYSLGESLSLVIAVSLAAYLVAVPLIAYHFGRFSPWAPLLSLAMLPSVTLTLVAGHLSLALAWITPGLSGLVGGLAAKSANLLAGIVEWTADLPAVSVELRPVAWWWPLACYASLAMLLARRRLGLGRWVTVATLLLLSALTAWTQRPAPKTHLAELHLLAVGDGQCAVLRTPSGRTVMLDAGSADVDNVGRSVVLPFLRHQRLEKPDTAIISHANADHYNALPVLATEAGLQRLIINDAFGVAGSDDDLQYILPVLATMDREGVAVVRVTAGDTIHLDDQTDAHVLWPLKGLGDSAEPNDRSLVLHIVCGDRSILVTGDIQSHAQAALLAGWAETGAPEIDVLVMPHHGSWQEALPAFVEALSPGTILISTDRPAQRMSTQPQSIAFYADIQQRVALFTTYDHGWTVVRFGPHTLDVQTLRPGP